jgi:hypothetical protein
MRGLGANEMNVVLGENFGEPRILRQEAVAGMHRVGAGDLAGGEQRRHVEVALAGGGRADAHALVGEAHMHGVLVRGRMHRDRGDAELLARAQHAQGDLAAVRDQDLVEHLVRKVANSEWRIANSDRATFFPPIRYSLLAIRAHSMIISGSPNSTG